MSLIHQKRRIIIYSNFESLRLPSHRRLSRTMCHDLRFS